MPRILHGEDAAPGRLRYRLELPDGSAPGGGFPFLLALHGRGESRDILAGRMAADHPLPYARLFPSGPIFVAGGTGDPPGEGFSWYDYDGDQARFLRALEEGEERLLDFVAFVARQHGLDPGRGALLGYSQGGYLGSFVALRNRTIFRGLVAVACRVKHEVLGNALAGAAGYPVLGMHGARDRAVRPGPQEEAFDVLRRHGLDVEWVLHPRGHGFPRDSLERIDGFVRRVVG